MNMDVCFPGCEDQFQASPEPLHPVQVFLREKTPQHMKTTVCMGAIFLLSLPSSTSLDSQQICSLQQRTAPPFLTCCYLEKISLPLRIPRPKTEGPWRGEWGLSTRATHLWLFMSQPHWGLSLRSASSPWTFEEPSLRTIIKRMAAVRERIMSVWISCSNTSASEYLINTNSNL